MGPPIGHPTDGFAVVRRVPHPHADVLTREDKHLVQLLWGTWAPTPLTRKWKKWMPGPSSSVIANDQTACKEHGTRAYGPLGRHRAPKSSGPESESACRPETISGSIQSGDRLEDDVHRHRLGIVLIDALQLQDKKLPDRLQMARSLRPCGSFGGRPDTSRQRPQCSATSGARSARRLRLALRRACSPHAAVAL